MTVSNGVHLSCGLGILGGIISWGEMEANVRGGYE